MMSVLRQQWFVVLLLWFAVLVSAGGAIYTRHRAREQFVELERLHRERDQLEVTWGNLELEKASLSANANVEDVAVTKLNMAPPDPAAIQVVVP
jgi:cell division protein FtsL